VDETTLHVWSLLGTAVGTIMMALVLLWASRQAIQQVVAVWRVVRGHRDEIIGAVDEPGDALIRRLEQLTTIPAGVWAALLPALLRSLARELDTWLEMPDEAATPSAYFDESTRT
jgi:hypothetical protein